MYLLEFAGDHDRIAAREAATAASGVRRLAVGLATARGVSGVERLAFTRRASRLVGYTAADVGSAEALLAAADLDRAGTVAVRARDVRASTGVDTQSAERVLGDVLADRGFGIDLEDPDQELRVAFAGELPDEKERIEPGFGGPEGPVADPREVGDPPTEGAVCALGWLAAESVRDYGDRKPTDRPFFQPGSMDPLLARALANLAGARPGARVVDPMCGTGGVLIEAGLAGADLIGLDAQEKMVRGTAENLAHYLGDDREWATIRADAARLPLRSDRADGVVFDAPYGRQSAIAGELSDLVGTALAEARRIAPRAVVVGDRSWAGAAEAAGWTVTDRFERRVHRSLTRHALVLRR